MSKDNLDNKWSQPVKPPSPLFIGQKEKNLVKQINDELIERVVGQQVLYYPISLDHTNFHSLYGEAIKKTFLPAETGLAFNELSNSVVALITTLEGVRIFAPAITNCVWSLNKSNSSLKGIACRSLETFT